MSPLVTLFLGFVLGAAAVLVTGARWRGKRPRRMPQDVRGAAGNPSGDPHARANGSSVRRIPGGPASW